MRVRAAAGGRPILGALLLALLVLPCVVLAQPGGGKIGYVDLKVLIDNAPQMIESRAQLQKEFAPRDARFKDDDTRLAALKQRYDRDGAVMSRADADALKRDIDTLERAIKRGRDELRSEVNARAAGDADRVLQQIHEVVIEFAREQGYDVVVGSPVVYASPRVDITDAVLERLRRTKPAAKATP